jgi:hypothetical protein
MDGSRFDDLTKTLVASTRSRRGLLRGLAGGALGAVFGGAAVKAAAAQDVGADYYSLTCRQGGTNFYCRAEASEVTTCGPRANNCVCATTKDDNTPKCVEEPTTGCGKDRCRRDSDCGKGEYCVRVPDCCTDSSKGKCARRCPK